MKIVVLKVFVLAAYAMVIAVNALANTLPLGGKTTGEVSDRYENLFTPAGVTFSIWGVIYLLLGAYVLHTLLTPKGTIEGSFRMTVIGVFLLSSFLNVAWLFAWHYERMMLSVFVMAGLLVTLAVAFVVIPATSALTRSAFSVYFAWISVAMIANVTVYLVKIGFGGFGLSETAWLVIVLALGVLLSAVVLMQMRDILFGLVFLWAYAGILLRHLSEDLIGNMRPFVLSYIGLCIVAIFSFTLYVFITNGMRPFGKT